MLGVTRDACSIEMGDHVIVTGGSFDSHVRAEVSVYNAQGWLEDYAGLNTGRKEHGCGHYINGDNNVVRVILNVSYPSTILQFLSIHH